MVRIKVVTHFPSEDLNFTSDYVRIEVFVEGFKAVEYGDSYHDKGQEKVQGFIDAYEYTHPKKVVVTYNNLADEDI